MPLPPCGRVGRAGGVPGGDTLAGGRWPGDWPIYIYIYVYICAYVKNNIYMRTASKLGW